MMKKEQYYENYPALTVFFSSIVSILTYLIGALIIYKLGVPWMILYIVFVLILEIKLIKSHCTSCYYYGKTCAFGKGRISSLFFRKGDAKNFCKKEMTWKDVLPDFLVSFIPIIAGIVLLIIKFNLILLLSVIVLFILVSAGNSIVRGQLACKYCKQRELGCPAEKLFSKNKK
jgi:hypothetical protein